MTDQIDAPEAVETEGLPDTEAQDNELANETEDQSEAEGEEQPEPKPKKTAQDRINEVTAARREAERERDYWRRLAIDGQQSPPQQQRPQPISQDEAPDPDQFTAGDADPRYLLELAKYEARQEIRREMDARSQQERLTTNLTTFNQRVADQFPDGEPESIATLRSMPAIRTEVTDVIFSSDKGPLMADYLGRNPSALSRLESLPAHMVGFELAKIEAGLSQPASPSPAKLTNAPSPAPKPRGSGGQFQVAPDTNDFRAFERFAEKVRTT